MQSLMQFMKYAFPLTAAFFLSFMCGIGAPAQDQAAHGRPVVLTVIDENKIPVSGAEVDIQEPGKSLTRLTTEYNGRVSYLPQGTAPYALQVQKAGFYASTANENDPSDRDIQIILNHEQMIVQQVNVSASAPGIDPAQVSDKLTMATPEIINIPYPTSRDIR